MTVQTPTCDCRRGFRNGQLTWVIHIPDCPGNPRLQPPPPPPPRRPRTALDALAGLRRAFRALKADLLEADSHLAAPSRRDWPPNCDILPAELSLGEQLRLLHDRAAFLVEDGNPAAEPLRRRVRKLLDLAAGFTAPVTSAEQAVAVPRMVQLALEHLAPRTPAHAALATPQPGDSPETARARWRVALWAAEHETS